MIPVNKTKKNIYNFLQLCTYCQGKEVLVAMITVLTTVITKSSNKLKLPQSPKKRSRLHYIDNLRWFMIIMVLVVHSGVTYGPVGDWFYRDNTSSDDLTNLILLMVGVLLQAFFMGLLFLIAGYFSPGSHDRKGRRKFVRDRFKRLVIPTLIFIFALGPLIVYPLELADEFSLADFYLKYIWYIPWWISGPMWFALALFGFSNLYTLLKYAWDWPTFEGALTRGRIVTLIALIVLGTFLVRLVFPIGTAVWNMQLCFFTQYIAFFVFGVLMFRNNWLASLTPQEGVFWRRVALASIFVLLLPLLVLGGALEENVDPYMGGLYWQAALFIIWEQLFAVSVSLGLLVWFRERYNRQGALETKLSDNAFAVYVFHPPILVGIAVLMASWPISNIFKFLILVVTGTLLTFAISEFGARRVPGLKDVL